MYKRWIHSWEVELSTRDRNRRADPFTWGIEHLVDRRMYLPDDIPEDDPHRFFSEYADRVTAASDRFFTPQVQPVYHFHDNWLTFASTVPTPYDHNNTVYGRFFPARQKPGDRNRPPVAIVLPQWNADPKGHVSVCQGLSAFGVASVRLSLPYHDSRRPPHQLRADYMVSPNIGRTIQACRQAVHDVRAVLDWLEMEGYTRFGIIGTSIGSCVSFLSYVHDARLRVGAFNHASSFFADVVWTGISTRHVREGLEGNISREQLRKYWSVISPHPYIPKLRGESHHGKKTLLIAARYDLTFLPHLSRQLIGEIERNGVPHQVSWLPCGHYTTGETPFKFYDGYLMINHVCRNLHNIPPQ